MKPFFFSLFNSNAFNPRYRGMMKNNAVMSEQLYVLEQFAAPLLRLYQVSILLLFFYLFFIHFIHLSGCYRDCICSCNCIHSRSSSPLLRVVALHDQDLLFALLHRHPSTIRGGSKCEHTFINVEIHSCLLTLSPRGLVSLVPSLPLFLHHWPFPHWHCTISFPRNDLFLGNNPFLGI